MEESLTGAWVLWQVTAGDPSRGLVFEQTWVANMAATSGSPRVSPLGAWAREHRRGGGLGDAAASSSSLAAAAASFGTGGGGGHGGGDGSRTLGSIDPTKGFTRVSFVPDLQRLIGPGDDDRDDDDGSNVHADGYPGSDRVDVRSRSLDDAAGRQLGDTAASDTAVEEGAAHRLSDGDMAALRRRAVEVKRQNAHLLTSTANLPHPMHRGVKASRWAMIRCDVLQTHQKQSKHPSARPLPYGVDAVVRRWQPLSAPRGSR